MAEKKKEYPALEETAFRMNGTFLKDGDAGAAFLKISESLIRIAEATEAQTRILTELAKTQSFQNSNLGVIRQQAETMVRQRADILSVLISLSKRRTHNAPLAKL